MAKARAGAHEPGIAGLFRGVVRRTTLLTIVVCACGLAAWWACGGKSDATPLWNGDKK